MNKPNVYRAIVTQPSSHQPLHNLNGKKCIAIDYGSECATMKPYNEQLETARRWDKSVDFGSPMTAWTDEMFEALMKCDGYDQRQPSERRK